jgi:hypothetical protein
LPCTCGCGRLLQLHHLLPQQGHSSRNIARLLCCFWATKGSHQATAGLMALLQLALCCLQLLRHLLQLSRSLLLAGLCLCCLLMRLLKLRLQLLDLPGCLSHRLLLHIQGGLLLGALHSRRLSGSGTLCSLLQLLAQLVALCLQCCQLLAGGHTAVALQLLSCCQLRLSRL